MLVLILYLLLLIGLLTFLVLISVYTIFLIYSSVKGAPYVPTRKQVIEEILKPAKIKKNKFFVELGSGDGRILRYAARRFGVRGVGFDVNPWLVFWSRILAGFERLEDKIDFQMKNVFDADLAKADYVYLFLMPALIEKLEGKMNRDLKKGSIVIAHGFPVKGWKKKIFYTLKKSPFPTYYYRI